MLKKACLVLVLTLALPATAASAAGFESLGHYGVGYPSYGSGQFLIAYGVGVSPEGTVAAADVAATRVTIFTQDGKFVASAGKDVSSGGGTGFEICHTDCKQGVPGEAAGELSTPLGLAAGATEFYVGDAGNNRVSVFDYQGNFLRAFGAGVGGPGANLCTTTCVTGAAGAGAGEMAQPGGVALNAAGELFVAEIGTARIDVFNPQTGQFLRAFGKDVGGPGVNTCTNPCGPGTVDGSPGSIGSAYNLSIAGGEVYASENSLGRVSVFGEDGAFHRLMGSPGSGAGQLQNPIGVAVDPAAGNVYVGDSGNYRLSTFSLAGGFLNARGADVVPGAPGGPEVCTSSCQAGNPAENGIGAFGQAGGVATDCRGAVYVAVVGRIEKYGDPAARKPPCPSNAFTVGKVKKNKKKGTLTVEVAVSGPGTLSASIGRKLTATVPQPQAAGTLLVTVKAAGKGVKVLKKKGKLKGNLSLTFTPPNGDPNTQSKQLTLSKKVKKPRKKPRKKPKTGKP